jgi:hypothetical protein
MRFSPCIDRRRECVGVFVENVLSSVIEVNITSVSDNES